MKKFLSTVLACSFAAATLSPVAVQASSFPTILGASKADEVKLEQVQRRYRHHHRHHRHYHRRGINPGAAAAAGIIGLGIGAAIASQPRYDYRDRDWDAYCFSKYKSYDPRTGTYLGYDGYRHPCR